MRFHFFIQSFSQLDQVYGKDVAQIIRDNSGLIYLKTNTMQTAQEISTMLGKQTLTSQSVSESMGTIAYNGNLSTSLMGRELLTADEVHKLVYKTIIFPTVGYPIFRKTILYNKLSCYRKGTLNRQSRPLLDLSHTYYTVNQINENNIEEMPLEVNRLLEEKKVHDTAILMDTMKIINTVLDDIKNISYEVVNIETNFFLRVIIPYIVNGDDQDRLETDIDNNVYHKIFNFIDNKTNIEIYLKNVF